MKKEYDKRNILLLSITFFLWQFGLVILNFSITFFIGIILIVFSIVLLILLIKKSEFRPYNQNPFKDSEHFINKRENRIKITVLLFFLFMTVVELEIFSRFNFSTFHTEKHFLHNARIIIPFIIMLFFIFNTIKNNNK